ncbi:hypothetical protein [Nonomuraea sp. 10N515B]|uniref:hypothetical protein n=1 Tax=Nonomuraea sp. 10N515B TaxID=3457422 RepID=UPI003FCD1BAD
MLSRVEDVRADEEPQPAQDLAGLRRQEGGEKGPVRWANLTLLSVPSCCSRTVAWELSDAIGQMYEEHGPRA